MAEKGQFISFIDTHKAAVINTQCIESQCIESEEKKTDKIYKIAEFANVVQIKDLILVADNVHVLILKLKIQQHAIKPLKPCYH